MIELNCRTLENPRGDRYGWNIYVSSTARTPYSAPMAQGTRDGPSSFRGAASRRLRWSYLFIVCDSPKQRRRAMVAGDDLAVRGNSCARAANRKGHVLDAWGSFAVMGSGDEHGHFNSYIRSKHLLFGPCFSAGWKTARRRWTRIQLGRVAQRLHLQPFHWNVESAGRHERQPLVSDEHSACQWRSIDHQRLDRQYHGCQRGTTGLANGNKFLAQPNGSAPGVTVLSLHACSTQRASVLCRAEPSDAVFGCIRNWDVDFGRE